jgi:23S rRNA U2552 (ribose-2'-O)-methylase RlmE/FtsJ
MYDLIDSGFESTAETRKIYQDFTRGINKYLDDKHIFKIKASNAFVKLWEIYHTHKVLNKKGVNAFHMCEAPGQWIRTTDEFIKIVFDGQIDYKWMANSLNPYNKSNIAKYGKDIISDTYQLMKTYRNQWVFGPHGDDTGDITKPNIIKWYREKFKDKSLNLITGDAGLPTDMPLVYLQKLDYAQCVLTLAVASKGANCVIKCFSPYMKNNPKTLKSTGFFVNLMYLYALHFKNVYLYKPYASRPQSGEFYIVGKKFVDVKDETIDLLLNVLDNFNENQVFIEKNNIPDNFERLVQDFLNRLVNYNIESIEVGFFINQCVMDENDTFGFQDVIKNYDKIQNKRFEAFCEKFSILELE